MNEKEFAERLTKLREFKGVSARDMSLSIGQNPGYINNIESGRALPSMSTFFYICDYLNITPADFFSTDNPYPEDLQKVIDDLKQLNRDKLLNIQALIYYMTHV
jgi:Predicted transcriptional regulators